MKVTTSVISPSLTIFLATLFLSKYAAAKISPHHIIVRSGDPDLSPNLQVAVTQSSIHYLLFVPLDHLSHKSGSALGSDLTSATRLFGQI